ncbi:MAG: glycoside hydrolase family 28 protein [Tannerella sp.]|jgi:hypothetical protein|nr:glycoside hydrolase family 28 protein [Tannerella sp.]
MKIKILITSLLLARGWMACPAGVAAKDYNILQYGAQPDGKTLNTESIQSAIDAISKAGGGRLIVPEGRFLTGSIALKSNVEFHLEKGAVLLGSPNPSDYRRVHGYLSLIIGENQNHLSVTGEGTIDGQGRRVALYADSLFHAGQLDSTLYDFYDRRPKENARPQIIRMFNCEHVVVRDIKTVNAACWVHMYIECDDVVIDRITVNSDAYWNNDGIDLYDSKNVRISNCHVDVADDGICLKSACIGKRNENIWIENCTIRSSASAIKFGSAAAAQNVTIKNLKIFDTFRSAIAIESVDGGVIENILVDGVEAVNTWNAIFIRRGNRDVYEAGKIGSLRNVTIRNMTVQVPLGQPDLDYDIRGRDEDYFHNTFPASVIGLPGYPVENVLLENIEITYPGRGNEGLAYMPLSRLKDIPEKESDYPEYSRFGELPAWGFYVRHVKGLTLKNVTVKAEKKDYRPAFVFDDVSGLRMNGIRIEEDDSDPQIILRNVAPPELQVEPEWIKKVD